MMRRLLLALPLLASAACSSMTGAEPDDSTREARGPGAGEGELTLTLVASPQEIVPGDTARLEATLRNPGAESVRIRFSSGCQLLIYVENAAGEVVHPSGGGWGCTAALTELTVPPRGSEVRADAWTGQEARWDSGSGLRRVALRAGSYQAYARLEGTLGDRAIRLQSPKVTVRIR